MLSVTCNNKFIIKILECDLPLNVNKINILYSIKL